MRIFRFAPSPTNQNEDVTNRGLHVGGLRTVLFNYAAAKECGGKLIMRVEDTDEARSNDECLKCIIKDLEWAGLEFDAGFKIVNNQIQQFNNTGTNIGSLRQSERKDIYGECAGRLLALDMAYEKDGATWFRMPKKDITFHDEVLGDLTLPAKDAQDFVIIKSSGIASFYFAVTVDDMLMGVTDVIRGMEHVNTTYRQVALHQALELGPLPTFGHIPLIMNLDGSKMSKRQTSGQVNVDDFRRSGYLPDALLNFLALLGWSDPDEKEIFNLEYMCQQFSLKDVNKSNAKFDYKKLENVNKQYIQALGDFPEKVWDHTYKYNPDFLDDLMQSNIDWQEFIKLYHPRSSTLADPAIMGKFFIEAPTEYNQKAVDKWLLKDNTGINVLTDLVNYFPSDMAWTPEAIDHELKSYATDAGLKDNVISQALRVSVAGDAVSPEIDKTLALLGQQEVISRINKCLDTFTKVQV
jgi:glutamyl-tRNA synthetase